MEIKDLILLMWRNARYIILGLVLGASVGIAVSKIQTPIYEASTKVFVSQVRQQNNSSMLSLSDEQLLAINLQLAKSQPVLNDVSAQLGSKVDADNIQAGAIPNTLIIQIKVQDNDPQRAAVTANLLVQYLIQQNEILLSGRYLGLEKAITEQVDQVQKQIDGIQTQIIQINGTGVQEQLTQVSQQIEQQKMEISGLQQEIASYPNTLTPLDRVTLAEKQAQLDQLHELMTLYQQIQTNLTYIGKPAQGGESLEDPQLAPLQSTLSLYQQIHQTLTNNRENVRLARSQSRQNVMQIVSATPPTNPVKPIPVLYLLLGSIMGLTLTAAGILLTDHLDDSLKSASQTEKVLGLPVLEVVFENKYSSRELVALSDPFSAEAETFRTLGVGLGIVCAEKKARTLLIMNAEPSGGKSSIAANLAIINAQQGKQVILLDGDLKHPHLHSLFEMENQKGFSELLDQGLDIKNACHMVKGVEGLTLITSGMTKKESAMWLDAEKLRQLLSKLQKQADLIIVDSPSADNADAQVLASKMDAIFLVLRSGHTRVDVAKATLRRIQLVGARVAGAVLNHTKQYNAKNKKFSTRPKMSISHNEKSSEVEGKVETSVVSAP